MASVTSLQSIEAKSNIFMCDSIFTAFKAFTWILKSAWLRVLERINERVKNVIEGLKNSEKDKRTLTEMALFP